MLEFLSLWWAKGLHNKQQLETKLNKHRWQILWNARRKEGKEHRRQWKTKEREDRDRKLLIVTKSWSKTKERLHALIHIPKYQSVQDSQIHSISGILIYSKRDCPTLCHFPRVIKSIQRILKPTYLCKFYKF